MGKCQTNSLLTSDSLGLTRYVLEDMVELGDHLSSQSSQMEHELANCAAHCAVKCESVAKKVKTFL